MASARNIAGQRAIRLRRSAAFDRPRYSSVTGMTTTAPSADRMNAIPATVNPSVHQVEKKATLRRAEKVGLSREIRSLCLMNDIWHTLIERSLRCRDAHAQDRRRCLPYRARNISNQREFVLEQI
jgi:hypothetical protein